MTTHATGMFKIKTWDEKPYDEIGGSAKPTRAGVTESFHGDIEGEGKVESLMIYRDDGSAHFFSVVRVAGSVGGRSGSFVLEGSGTHAAGTAQCAWTVVAGAGTGALTGLQGKGGFVAKHADYPDAPFALDYDFE